MAKSCRKVFAVLGAICLASHVLSVQALYDASSSVKVLNAAKLSKALDTRGVLLVEFFAPWVSGDSSVYLLQSVFLPTIMKRFKPPAAPILTIIQHAVWTLQEPEARVVSLAVGDPGMWVLQQS